MCVCVYPTSRKITSIYNQVINHRFGYCQFYLYGGFNKWWYPKNSWFIMENPIKIDDLEVSLFQETSTCGWVGKESQFAVCWGMDINKLRAHSQGTRVPSATARYPPLENSPFSSMRRFLQLAIVKPYYGKSPSNPTKSWFLMKIPWKFTISIGEIPWKRGPGVCSPHHPSDPSATALPGPKRRRWTPQRWSCTVSLQFSEKNPKTACFEVEFTGKP